MNWEIEFEPAPINVHVEIYEGTLRERTPDKWERCFAGPLARVECKYKYTGPLKWKAVMLYEEMKYRFPKGYLIPFQEIRDRFPDWHPTTVRKHIAKLWYKGYIEKFAAGEWGQGWRGKNRRSGKHHGVHYRVIK